MTRHDSTVHYIASLYYTLLIADIYGACMANHKHDEHELRYK